MLQPAIKPQNSSNAVETKANDPPTLGTVVGAIIGSDIYIASALTARLIGPFSIVVWIVAGIIATILAMIFAYSAY